MRNSLIKLFFWQIFMAFACALVSEASSLLYNYMVRDMIKYVKYEEGLGRGVFTVAKFIVPMWIA